MEAKILAGPILRRTTRNRVCVWLATSEKISLQLTVMDARRKRLGQGEPSRPGDQCVQLGDNLYIYLLQARPDNDAGYPADELMYYHIDRLASENNARTPLFLDAELKKLVYGSHPYPSFFIPTKLKHLLHGSCRKPHGGFHSKDQLPMPDALSHGHTLLEKTCNDNDMGQRPAILLMTGDQIYADDVAISLLAMLRPQAIHLTGKNETLPMADGASSPTPRLDPSTIPLHGRKRVLDEKHNASGQNSGFSSDESENHLFAFGEFAAMYIYIFGNRPAWEPVWDWGPLKDRGVAAGEEESAEEAWAAQRSPLGSFHDTLADIRRLLANIPTYMIFDDHDVTDDWNITGDWYDSVRESPLGRRIVSNALAAYWAFQGWGNDPDNFDKDLIRSITRQLNDTGDDKDIGERYDLHTWKSRGWGFSIPTDPPIIAMDSRTQRQYDKKCYSAELLDRYALDWLRIEWVKLKTGQTITGQTITGSICPVLIAATPVMGYSVVETYQRLLLGAVNWVESLWLVKWVEGCFGGEGFLTDMVVDRFDVESWSANKAGFFNFMNTVSDRMGITRCVFLSGDVHYAFSANAIYRHKNRTLHCYQLTSSSLSNEPNDMQSHLLRIADKNKIGISKHREWALKPGCRWCIEEELVGGENGGSPVTPKCNLGLVEFADGLPVSHTLLTGDGNLIYSLPEAGGATR